MRKQITRVVSILAIAALGIFLPACESSGDYGYTTTYVGVGYGVYGYGGYGGYYGAGCCYGGGGAVVVHPPVYGGARVVHH